MSIPPIFYQSWDKDLPDVIFNKNKICIPETFIYKRYSIKNIIDYLTEKWPHVLNKFNSYYIIQHKIDLWRYCILYDTLGVNGLNLKIPKFDDVYKCVGKERRNQMSKQLLGNKHRLGKIPWNKGYKHTGDTSNFAPKNPKKLNAQEKLQRSIDVKKVRSTPESRLKTSIASKGGRNANAKKVIQISTGVIFGSLSEAANNANMNKHSLGHYLRGRFYNKTDYRYLNS